ncbi:hypothetical protein ACFSGX_11310 [Sphingomonas arantia]|uniref:Uncharacterized protein n=1 Tax=Sphingomonas arantia TaxID=1460676 RepID=A0ABW4TZE9_9SPHN
MATQFKHADFTQTAAPRPNVRIAYAGGLTTTAVNRALAATPAAIRDATLDELAGEGGIAVAPWLESAPRLDPSAGSLTAATNSATSGAIVLPALPAGTSQTIVGFVDGYRAAYFSEEETAGDEVVAAADLLRLYPATTPADLATKLMISIHHAQPLSRGGALAVDPTELECPQAGEMLMSTLTDALRLAADTDISDIAYSVGPTGNRTPAMTPDRVQWDTNLAAYRLANEAFIIANAPYAQMYADDPRYAEAEAVSSAAMDVDTAAERVLFATPAPDLAAARTKLDIALGANVQIEEVKSLADDLRRVAEAAAPEQYDRFMAGPLIQWNRAYDRYIDAQAERMSYECAVFNPAATRYEAVRAIWPMNYNIADDRVASAALQAVEYDQIDARYSELCSEESEALQALYRKIAPGPSELATKLQLFEAHAGWDYTSVAEILPVLVSDARRFGKHGAFKRTDWALLDAHAGLRADAEEWFERGPHSGRRDDENSAKVAALEATLWNERATTIEGVLAKLTAIFPHIVIEGWSDRAVLDPRHPDFREGLAKTGVDYQALWSAIDDLARIGGVNLAELGA